jgi:hypothetical protein
MAFGYMSEGILRGVGLVQMIQASVVFLLGWLFLEGDIRADL